MTSITKRFTSIPENAVASSNVLMTIHLEDIYNEDELTITKSFEYHWYKIDDNVYDLQIDYSAEGIIIPGGDFNKHYYIPVYVTIKVYFMNENTDFLVQSEGK